MHFFAPVMPAYMPQSFYCNFAILFSFFCTFFLHSMAFLNWNVAQDIRASGFDRLYCVCVCTCGRICVFVGACFNMCTPYSTNAKHNRVRCLLFGGLVKSHCIALGAFCKYWISGWHCCCWNLQMLMSANVKVLLLIKGVK